MILTGPMAKLMISLNHRGLCTNLILQITKILFATNMGGDRKELVVGGIGEADTTDV